MKFNTQAEVTGVKKFNDAVDGMHYDFTEVFIKTELDESRESAVGFATMPMKFGTSAEYEKLKGHKFPFMADMTIELTTTGKTEKKMIISLKPIQAAKAS